MDLMERVKTRPDSDGLTLGAAGLSELRELLRELAELRLQSETTARCVANVTAQPGLPRVHTEGEVERDGFVDGVWQARREYCAAWAEGCGGLLDDADFSVQFVRRKARELAELRAGQKVAIEEALRQQAAAACKRVEVGPARG